VAPGAHHGREHGFIHQNYESLRAIAEDAETSPGLRDGMSLEQLWVTLAGWTRANGNPLFPLSSNTAGRLVVVAILSTIGQVIRIAKPE
jgi:hypothetical protein